MSFRRHNSFHASSPVYSSAGLSPLFANVFCDFFTLSGFKSHKAFIPTPSINVYLPTAPVPRFPNPINPTLTVGIGSTANCSTSLCPFSRGGSGLFICPDGCAKPLSVKNSTKKSILKRFIRLLFEFFILFREHLLPG
ncbi:hypothetical protein DSECCO2_601550 [anaerobic digester metagenome]